MQDYHKRYRLMCPGPINVSRRVSEAMVSSEIGHREIEFSALLQDIRRNCLSLMGLSPDQYSMVILTGSGSSANESVICSAIRPEEHVLVLCTGEFGRRLGEISAIYNPETTVYKQDWATQLDLNKVEHMLAENHFDWVLMVHHETSTGELQPVHEVGALCKKYGARLYVDAVSSFMVDPLDLQECNITLMGTSSGKGIGMGPGLSIVVGRTSEFEKLSTYPVRNYYLSLARHYDYFTNKQQTPNTPAISLFIAMAEAFQIIAEESMQSRYQFQAQKASHFRKGLAKLGLKLLRPDHKLSNAVSTICLPDNLSFETLRERLRSLGFIVYGGKGPLADKIFQVSTMGAVDFSDIDALLEAIESIVKK